MAMDIDGLGDLQCGGAAAGPKALNHTAAASDAAKTLSRRACGSR